MGPNECRPAVEGVANAATAADLIVALCDVEVTELSNLDSSGSTIDCVRVNKALLDAYYWLMSQQLLLAEPAKPIVDLNLNRWMIVVARYLLDTLRRRPDVAEDMALLRADLDKAAAASAGSALRQNELHREVWSQHKSSPVFTASSLARQMKTQARWR
jgi:hypothetical protein